MRYVQFGRHYMVRLEADEEIIQALSDFAADRRIDFAAVSGIGSAREVVLGACQTSLRDTATPIVCDNPVIVSLLGNLTIRSGRPFVHVHVTLAGSDHQALSGHLVSARVNGTCELFVSTPGGYLQRVYDPQTDLELLDI